MIDLFIPDMYVASIYKINYKKLKKNGIKCILFDLDNTIAPYKIDEPDGKIKELFARLQDDFKIIIISNNNKNRVRPFKEKLNVDSAFSSKKPLKNKYKKILKKYKFKDTQIAAVGDQLLTDIFGANRMEFTSILVNRISSSEPIPMKINRFFEGFIKRKLERRGILKVGEYYD